MTSAGEALMEEVVVESAAAEGADLLMECDEEEQEVWPPSPRIDEAEQGKHDEGECEANMLFSD